MKIKILFFWSSDFDNQGDQAGEQRQSQADGTLHPDFAAAAEQVLGGPKQGDHNLMGVFFCYSKPREKEEIWCRALR
jgi:hypothetical protein